MNVVLTNHPRTYFHLAALVVLVVKAMGSGTLSWGQAVATAAALFFLPWFVSQVLKKIRKPAPGPKDGGDVRIGSGRPGPGGIPGRIVFEQYGSDEQPFLCFENGDCDFEMHLYMGREVPDTDSIARPGSFYLQLGAEPVLYFKQEPLGGWVPMLRSP